MRAMIPRPGTAADSARRRCAGSVLRDRILSRTGLGLTLCREILAAHGRRRTLAHRQDGEAVVTVYLP